MSQEYLSDIITLTDEMGEEIDLEFLGEVEYNNNNYIVFLPNFEDENQEEVLILKIVGNSEEGESYETIEDDQEVDAVFEIFMKENQDLFEMVEDANRD